MMGDQVANPRQLWAILAPLAAMAGLIFYMRRRRNPDEHDTVKRVVKEVNQAEKEIQPVAAPSQPVVVEEEEEPLIEKQVIEPVTIQQDVETEQAAEADVIEAEVVEETVAEVVEAEKNEGKVVEVMEAEDIPVVLVEEEKEIEQVEVASSSPEVDDELQEEEGALSSEPVMVVLEEEHDSGMITMDQPLEESIQAAVDCAPLVEPSVEQELEELEPVVVVEEEEVMIEDEVKEELQVAPLQAIIDTGSSGTLSAITTATSRFRTESERAECEDWTNSPKPKKETPKLELKPATTRQAKRDSAKKVKGGYARRLADSDRQKQQLDDRESTTTSPDSAKDLAMTTLAKGEKQTSGTKKKTRPKKRSGRKAKSAAQGQSTTTTDNMTNSDSTTKVNNDQSEITSSDSGTATDDQDTYLEIEGFPTHRIGALIGKSGASIKKLQQDSKCKIVVKTSSFDTKQQTISIEGRVKNIHKALGMLNKRFPELNLAFTDTSNLNAFYDQSATAATTAPASPDEQYNYDEFFMGSVNNNSLQVELAEAVDVEVRVTTIGPSFPEVWLQPFTHPTHAKFDRLETSMNEFYSTDKDKSVLTTYLPIGDMAVCLHHAADETSGQEMPGWYRVQIIQYPDDHNVVIMYTDFGGYATVPLEMVRKLMPDFFPLYSGVPFQAVCATIHDVHPPNVDKKNADYITAAHVYLQDVISKAAPNSMRAYVHFFDAQMNTPQVSLKYRNELNEEVDVNQLLREKFQSWGETV